MTPEQKAAFVIAQAACASAKVAGMQAENQRRVHIDRPVTYNEEDFAAVPYEFGLGHNAVLILFRED